MKKLCAAFAAWLLAASPTLAATSSPTAPAVSAPAERLEILFAPPIVGEAAEVSPKRNNKISLRVRVRGPKNNLVTLFGPQGYKREWRNISGERTAVFYVNDALPAGEARFEVEGKTLDGQTTGDEILFKSLGPTTPPVEIQRQPAAAATTASTPMPTATAMTSTGEAEDGLRVEVAVNRPVTGLMTANSTEAGRVTVGYCIPMEGVWSISVGADALLASLEAPEAGLAGPGPRIVRPRVDSVWLWKNDRIAVGGGPNLDLEAKPQQGHELGMAASWQKRIASASLEITGETDIGAQGLHNWSLGTNGTLWLGRSIGPVQLGLAGDVLLKRHLLAQENAKDLYHATQVGGGLTGGFELWGQSSEVRAVYIFGVDGKSPSALLLTTSWRP